MSATKGLTRQRPNRARTRPVPKARSPRPARRRAARKAAWRRRAPWIGSGAVLVVVGILVAVSLLGSSTPAGRGRLAPSDVVRAVTGVPAGVLDGVGAGQGASGPAVLPARTPPLLAGGRPWILYVGAEYCPYCAGERWPLIVALSRFGTFSHLGATESSTTDAYPATKTFSFHGATYRSRFLRFTAVELRSNRIVGGTYAPLDRLTPEERQVVAAYDRPPYVTTAGAIPFLDIGGRYVLTGSQFSLDLLQGLGLREIARQLSDPVSPVAQAVDGSANGLTAAICPATGGRPASVCTSPGVARARRLLRNSA